jgi:hypothetical protein
MGKKIQENSFEGSPAGAGGTCNYSTGYGTPSVVQNPAHFASPQNNKPDNNFSQLSGSSGSPLDLMDKNISNSPLDPTKSFEPQVNQLFQKQNTPSPDEIMSALQYEMNQMVKKDKTIAKQIVLKNLKSDPQYYSRLNMLNIDDDKMKVNEDNSTFGKTKKVLDEMVVERKNKVVPKDDNLNQIFKEMWNRRNGIPSQE